MCMMNVINSARIYKGRVQIMNTVRVNIYRYNFCPQQLRENLRQPLNL